MLSAAAIQSNIPSLYIYTVFFATAYVTYNKLYARNFVRLLYYLFIANINRVHYLHYKYQIHYIQCV